jgi:hypothetical protein
MKKIIPFLLLLTTGIASAQYLPIYDGNNELLLLGGWNQSSTDVNIRYGRYIADTFQMGFYGEFADSSFYTRTGFGAVFIKSFDTPVYLIPYLGTTLGYGQLKRGPADESGIELQLLVGFRYFLSDSVSLNTEFNIGVSSADSFLDNSTPESMDMGVRVGFGYSW